MPGITLHYPSKKNGEDYARFSWQNYSLGGGDKGVPEALELRPNEIGHNLETKKLKN